MSMSDWSEIESHKEELRSLGKEQIAQRQAILSTNLQQTYMLMLELEKKELLLYGYNSEDRTQLYNYMASLKNWIAQAEVELKLLQEVSLELAEIEALAVSRLTLPPPSPPKEAVSLPTVTPYEGANSLPVYKKNLFVGREPLLEQLKAFWDSDSPLAPVVLYGHKFMGKTSILYNLNLKEGSQDLPVVVELSKVDSVETNARFFYLIAREIEAKAKAAGFRTGDLSISENFDTTANATTTMDDLLERLSRYMKKRRLILALDSFDLLQHWIEQGRVGTLVLEYLLEISHTYGWLGLVFAGSNAMEEVRQDYRSLFYSNAKHLNVSYLEPEAARKLITQPDYPDFALRYEPALVEAIYGLTFGQPYLIQVLCNELVYQWNDRWERNYKQLGPLLKITDLQPALTDHFFERASPYFEGVWKEVAPTGQKLMQIVAQWQQKNRGPNGSLISIHTEEVQKLAGLNPTEFEQFYATLSLHDLMQEENGHLTFRTELLRRWVVRQKP